MNNGRDGVQSVSRAIELLRMVARIPGEGVRLQDLVLQSQLSKPTVHRLLKQLVAEGMLTRGLNRTYQLGMGAFELGVAATKGFPLRDLARPVLEKLATDTGDSVFLVVRSGADSLCVDRKLGAYPIKLAAVDIGYRQPMGVGAGGLAILSFLGDEERAQLLPLLDKRLAEHSYGNLTGDRLRTLITETRGRGWATVTGFAEPGVTGVGIPLFNARKQPFAAITVGGFSLRMTEARIAQSVSILRAQTAQLW